MAKKTNSKKKIVPKKETRQMKALRMGQSILQISMSKKKSSAFIKLAINDDLAQKLMKQNVFFHLHEDGFPTIMGLSLNYEENLTPLKKG